MLIISIIFAVKSGGAGAEISMQKTVRSIVREYFMQRFYRNVKEYILKNYGQKIIKAFTTLLYSHHCDFTDIDFAEFRRECKYYSDEDFDELEQFIMDSWQEMVSLSNFHALQDDFKKRGFGEEISIRGNDVGRMQEQLLLIMRYDNLEYISRGNQWTMRYRAEMEYLRERNYIEMFASPFNRKLNRFCSMFDTVRAFGAIGTYEQTMADLILETSEETVNLCISPPSGYSIQKKLVEHVIKLLKLRRANISMGLSINEELFSILYASGFMLDFRFNDYCYDYTDGVYIEMTQRPWLAITLSSLVGAKIQLYFPRESPHENSKLMEQKKELFLRKIKASAGPQKSDNESLSVPLKN